MFLRTSLPTFKNILWLQWMGATAAFLMTTVTSMMLGMLSPFLAQATAENATFPITLAEASWVVALVSPGRIMGSILGSLGVQCFGCKMTLLSVAVPVILAWICLVFTESVYWVYGSSLARGISFGMLYIGFPFYLGEVASPASRGTLVAYAASGLPLGTLLGNVLGTYLHKTMTTYFGLVPTVIFVIMLLYVPESPHYLVRKGEIRKAESSIHKYNPQLDVQAELQSITEFVTESKSITVNDRLQQLAIPRNRKAATIIFLLYMFMQFSGLNTLMYYMEISLRHAKVTIIRPATVVVIANVLDIIAGWIASFTADIYGRRMMWSISSGGAALAMIGAGLRFTLLNYGYDPETHQWLPITSLICYRIFLYIGLCSVPSMYVSELIAPTLKSMVVCFCSIFGAIFAFISTKSYQPLVDNYGEAYVYYGYAVIMTLASIFGMALLPETTGKTLQEIQKM